MGRQEPERDSSIHQTVERLRNLREGPSALFEVVALGEAAVPSLERLLRGPSESVHQPRSLAADALAAIGGPAAVDALLRAFLDSTARNLEPVLRQSEGVIIDRIAEHLGRTKDPRVADALLAALREGHYPGCAVALGAMGDERAIPLLVECLHNDVGREAAMGAIRQLGPSAVPALVRALAEPHVKEGFEGPTRIDGRAAAATLLGEFGGAAACAALRRAIGDEQRRVRIAAAIALRGCPGDTSTIASPVLVDALDEEEWHQADPVMQRLAELGPEVATALLPIISSSAEDAAGRRRRLRAVEVLGRTKAVEEVETLQQLADDGDPRLRWAAVSALAQISCQQSTVALAVFLNDREPAVRRRSLEILYQRGALSAAVAVRFLGEPNREIRTVARHAIRAAGPTALPVVGKVLRRLGAPACGLVGRTIACWEAFRVLVSSRQLPKDANPP